MGWVPSISETRRAGERQAGGPSRNLIKFQIVQKHPNLIQTKNEPPLLKKIEIKYY
jgi:hypothetical protein